ncbi:MAG: hypothetical protein HY735_27815, partial [Verrucomicrobia bacterium]|nr:hypothetical protein [Verrucomicrobiota bacterium]
MLALCCLLAEGPVAAQRPDRDVPVHKVDGSFIRDWLVLGPFPSVSLETDFLTGVGGEANVRPKEGDSITTSDGTNLAWTRIHSAHDLVNLEEIFGMHVQAVAYAYCELNCDQAFDSDVRFMVANSAQMRFNGNKAETTQPSPGSIFDMSPVLPMKLNSGRNACLLKLSVAKNFWQFSFQPLPSNRAVAELKVTGRDQRSVADAVAQFYAKGAEVVRMKTDQSGKVEARLYPLAEEYDLRVTAGEMGAWLFGVSFRPGERRKIEVVLKDGLSVSGQTLAMDGSPQTEIVVQALSENARSAALPLRRESTAEQLRPAEDGKIRSLLPLPAFSETVLTDTNGFFRFVNLRPGQYRLLCQGPNGFVDPEAIQGTNPSVSRTIAVEAGQTYQGVRFVSPESKKGVSKNYRIPKGLSDVTALTLHRTGDGVLWIGTDDSLLFSFDGFEFTMNASSPEIFALEHAVDGTLWVGTSRGISRHVAGRTEVFSPGKTLVRNVVGAIHADSDGTVWFATDGGLAKFDGRRFVTFTIKDGLPSNGISSLLRARDGTLWALTACGLARFDGQKFALAQPFPAFFPPTRAFHQAKDGALWFGTEYDGAYRYDGKTLSRLGVENGLPSDQISAIAETPDGALWFGTRGGISKFDGTTVINYAAKDLQISRPPRDFIVKDICVDSDGVLWCAARSGGICRFDPNNFDRFTKLDGLRDLEGETAGVYAIEPDLKGGFWIGAGWGGVFHTDGTRIQSVPSSSGSGWVRRIHRAADGTLLFGTSNGIYKYENERMVQVLQRPSVIGLASDAEGNLWYGYGWYGEGLSRYDPKTGVETVFRKEQGLPNDQVWAIERGSNGGLWVGTAGGLARWQDGKIEDFGRKFGISNEGIYGFRRDADETLWISSDRGLHRLKGFECVSITGTNELLSQLVWCNVRTRDGHIWMGTDKNGLLGYDGRAVTVIDQRDGLLGYQVAALATNVDDSLWIGTLDGGLRGAGGLNRYKPTKSRPKVRLASVQWEGRTLTNFDSKLSGLNTGQRVTIEYRELDLKTHPEKHQFWYRLAKTSGETVFAGVTKERRFEWTPESGGTYSFEIQAIDRDLNYSAPARLAFRATVPWFANAWILVPGGAAFGGFFIWAFIARALYVKKTREAVQLREQMLVQERQARAALQQSNRSLSEAKDAADAAKAAAEIANRAKSTFLANMSHEIRTPLNAVLGYAQILMRDRTLGEDQRQSAGTIERSGNHLLKLINEILDLSKIESGKMELAETDFDLRELIRGVSEMFELRCRQKGLEWQVKWLSEEGVATKSAENTEKEGVEEALVPSLCSLRSLWPTSDSSSLPVRGDEGKLRQVLINLLGNAVKFTEHGQVTLWVIGRTGRSASGEHTRPRVSQPAPPPVGAATCHE